MPTEFRKFSCSRTLLLCRNLDIAQEQALLKAVLFSQLKADKLDALLSSPKWHTYQRDALEMLDWAVVSSNGEDHSSEDTDADVVAQLRLAIEQWLKPQTAQAALELLDAWAASQSSPPSAPLTLLVVSSPTTALLLSASTRANLSSELPLQDVRLSAQRYQVASYFWSLGKKVAGAVEQRFAEEFLDWNPPQTDA